MTQQTNEQRISLQVRFRDLAEEVLTKAKAFVATRDELDRQITNEAAKDKADEAEEQRLEAMLAEVKQRRAGRAQWLAERLTERQTADRNARQLEAEGRQAIALIDQMSTDQPSTATVDTPADAETPQPGTEHPDPEHSPVTATALDELTAFSRNGQPGGASA